MLYNKKARVVWGTLILMILTLIAFSFFFTKSLQSVPIAEKIITDDVCEQSIGLRLKTKMDLIVTDLAPPLLCMTHDTIELPKHGDTSEDLLRDLSNLIVDIWRIWKRGKGEEQTWKGLFRHDAKSKCFTYQPIVIKKLKDKDEVTIEELYRYMNNHLYYVEEEDVDYCKYTGGFCYKDEDTFKESVKDIHKANLIYFDCETRNQGCIKRDAETPTCCYNLKYTCLNKGGICEDADFQDKDYVKYDKWRCPRKKKCFVTNKNYITYLDYIRDTGGYLQIQEGINFFTPLSQGYELAFATRVDANFRSSFDRIFKGADPPRIIIAKVGALDNYCMVQKDIKGR